MKIKHIIIGVSIFLIIGGGSFFMVKREERNMAIKNIQEKVSTYITENYVGIKKIEWRGWGVSNVSTVRTAMVVNDYPLNENYEPLFSYKANGEKYIEKQTDVRFSINPYTEDDDSVDVMEKKFRKQGVKKDPKGSPNAKIIYNWEED